MEPFPEGTAASMRGLVSMTAVPRRCGETLCRDSGWKRCLVSSQSLWHLYVPGAGQRWRSGCWAGAAGRGLLGRAPCAPQGASGRGRATLFKAQACDLALGPRGP